MVQVMLAHCVIVTNNSLTLLHIVGEESFAIVTRAHKRVIGLVSVYIYMCTKNFLVI